VYFTEVVVASNQQRRIPRKQRTRTLLVQILLRGIGLDIQILKLCGTLLSSGRGFQNHVVLIQLCVHCADLTLSVSVIKCAVDCGRAMPRRDAVARSITAIPPDLRSADQWRRLRAAATASSFRQAGLSTDSARSHRDLPMCTGTECG